MAPFPHQHHTLGSLVPSLVALWGGYSCDEFEAFDSHRSAWKARSRR